MASNSIAARRRSRHRHRRRLPEPRESSLSEEVETIRLDDLRSERTWSDRTTIVIPLSSDDEDVDESPLVKIIERKQRKDW